jgi:secreted trypsin-like serine protease
VTIYKAAITALITIIAAITADLASAQEVNLPKTPLDQIKERVARGLIHQKIILGRPAPAGAYPFQVSMISASTKKGQEFDGHFCGATFISPTWILTAAHCITEDGDVASPKSIEIYAGSHNFRNGDRIPVKSIYRHPKYVDNFIENDVALLQLVRAPKAGTKYKAIDLIEPSNEAAQTSPGTSVTIIGWGTTENEQLSQVLQHTTVKIVERAECNRNILSKRAKDLDQDLADVEFKFRIAKEKMSAVREAIKATITGNAGPIVTDSMICAGEANPSPTAEQVKDTCQGDSGGPLVGKGPNGTPLQVGIVSWGEGCGVPTVHGVYTRLAKLTDWVKTTARD